MTPSSANRKPPSTPLNLVSGKGRGEARLEVATSRAGWVTSYDVSWDEDEAQLQISRFARVVQTTGQPWKDVTLELRTGQPLRGAVRRQAKAQLQTRAEVSYDGYCANVQWVNSGLSDVRARQDVLSGRALASNWRMAVGDKVDVAGTGKQRGFFLTLTRWTPPRVGRPVLPHLKKPSAPATPALGWA